MKYIYLCLLCLLLNSCAKIYNSKKVIQNDSSQTISVIIYQRLYNNKIGNTILIKPNTVGVIEQFAPSRTDPAYITVNGCAHPPMDSIGLEVYDNSSLKITKDISNSSNWVLNRSSKYNEVNVECRMIIKDSDIVPK